MNDFICFCSLLFISLNECSQVYAVDANDIALQVNSSHSLFSLSVGIANLQSRFPEP
jgi:hypothetical protein